MELQFCGKVSGVCGFGGVEIADVLMSFIDLNPCVPAFCVLVPRHPEEAGSVASLWACLILQIDGRRNVTQVCYPIVALVAIDMIDLIVRPRVIRVQPCQSMSQKFYPVDPDAGVAAIVDRPSNVAHFYIAAIYPPAENSRLRLVVQQASQGFGGGAFHF